MATKDDPGKSPGKPAQGKDEAKITLRRRAYEYGHDYGLRLDGGALEPAPKPPKPGSGRAGDKR